MPITANQMDVILSSCAPGSVVFVSYMAGRDPTDRALAESERAVSAEGMARRHYVGVFRGIWTTKKGQRVMTIMAFNRDKLVGDKLVEGGFRTFNPELGRLLYLEVITPI